MNPLSNETVLGYQYKVKPEGLGGSGPDIIQIFVPSKNLVISKDSVMKSDRPFTPKKVAKVMDQYERTHTFENLNYEELKALEEEAKKKAMKEVQVPVVKVDKIMAFLEKKEELVKQMSSLDASISEIANTLF